MSEKRLTSTWYKIMLYKKATEGIENYIKSNNLSAGAKLPSTREFAQMFGISKQTVYIAFEELCGMGAVESKPRSGYYVSYNGWNNLFQDSVDWKKYLDRGLALEQPKGFMRLLTEHVIGEHYGASKYLVRAMRRCVDDISYIETRDNDCRGMYKLRELICAHVKRCGIVAEPDQILVTYGFSH